MFRGKPPKSALRELADLQSWCEEQINQLSDVVTFPSHSSKHGVSSDIEAPGALGAHEN